MLRIVCFTLTRRKLRSRGSFSIIRSRLSDHYKGRDRLSLADGKVSNQRVECFRPMRTVLHPEMYEDEPDG